VRGMPGDSGGECTRSGLGGRKGFSCAPLRFSGTSSRTKYTGS